MTHHLILASSSPRRQSLLKQVKIPFSVRKPDVDESQVTVGDPEEKVKQLAMLKGKATPLTNKKEVILSADTVVAYKEEIFGKPRNEQDAHRMLSLFSGFVHDVYTGVMLRSADQDRKSTRLNSSYVAISYAVFCLKKKNTI